MKQFLLFRCHRAGHVGHNQSGTGQEAGRSGVPPGNSNPYIRRESRRLPAAQLARRILRTEKGKLLVQARQDTRRQGAGQYTADEVESIEYVEKTEAHPDGIRWEALDIASPGLRDRYRTFRRLVCLNKASQNATTYWWKIWTTERVGNIDRRVLKTVYGIRFHDDPDRPFIRICWSTPCWWKTASRIAEVLQNMVQRPEGKVRKKEAKENDAWMLDMYDAYLAAQADK